MGSQVQVTYYLPVTQVRMRAFVTTTTDTILRGDPLSECSGLDLALQVVADATRLRSLKLESGTFRDYSFQMGLTEDGRLTKAGVETTGQVLRTLGGVATAATGLAVLATGSFPAALAAVGTAAATQMKGGPGQLDRGPSGHAEKAPSDPVADAYRTAQPEAAKRLADLATERAAAEAALVDARATYRVQVADPDGRVHARAAYRGCREILRDVDADLADARSHFTAWRHGTLEATREPLDVLTPVEALPTYSPEVGLTFRGDEHDPLRVFFAKAGTVLARWGESAAESLTTTTSDVRAAEQSNTDVLHVLRPRRITLVTVTGHAANSVRVAAVHRELVMDRACEELHLPIRKSWNARRRTAVELSDLGALTGLDLNGSSSAGAAATAAADLVPSLAASLESASKATAAAGTVAASGAERELTELTRLVAIQEQTLLAAGQAATAEDYAKLAKLRQAAEQADLEAKIRAAQPQSGP